MPARSAKAWLWATMRPAASVTRMPAVVGFDDAAQQIAVGAGLAEADVLGGEREQEEYADRGQAAIRVSTSGSAAREATSGQQRCAAYADQRQPTGNTTRIGSAASWRERGPLLHASSRRPALGRQCRLA